MNIQKRVGSCMSFYAVLGLVCCALSQEAFSKEVANVNGRVITDRDVTLSLGALNDGLRATYLKDPNNRLQTVQGLVDQEVLVQEAEKLKLDQDPDFKDTLTGLRKQLLVNQLLDKKISAQLTPAALQKYFQLHKDVYSTSTVHVQQILLDDEAEAKAVKKLAEAKPNEFLDLADKRSKDPRVKVTHGDLGFVGYDTLVKDFTDVAFATPDGKIAGPIKTLYGYHVIKVVEKNVGKSLEFSEVELRVRDALKAELIRNYIDQLRAQTKIKISEADVLK